MTSNVGLIKRLLINFYDFILLFAVMYFFTIPVIFITDGNAIINNIFYQIYLILIIYLYFAWFWINYNQTLGMKIWKVKIFSKDTIKITYSQSIKRIIISLMGGHILLLFSSESLQDKLSNTYLENIS
tara:strand:- start:198 stop:581 length:384 start_codon:yes stop_codon:yes gene_type:complete